MKSPRQTPPAIPVFDIGARGGIGGLIPNWVSAALPIEVAIESLKVYGFEPDPAALEVLRRTGHYQDILPHGLARNSGPAKLYVTREPYKSSTLQPDLAAIRQHFGDDWRDYDVDKIVEVECLNLDELAQQLGVFPKWLKLDTQGSEIDVLRGAPTALAQAQVVVLELSSIAQYHGQVTATEGISLLFDSGFDLAACNYKPQAPYENDFVFIRRLNADSDLQSIWSCALYLTLLGLFEQATALCRRTGAHELEEQLALIRENGAERRRVIAKKLRRRKLKQRLRQISLFDSLR